MLGLSGVQTVITADVVDYDTTRKFDRVMSIEMFEHMKNYQVRCACVSQAVACPMLCACDDVRGLQLQECAEQGVLCSAGAPAQHSLVAKAGGHVLRAHLHAQNPGLPL